MSRRCRNKSGRALLLAAGLAGCVLSTPAMAAPPGPLVMGPLYVEPARSSDNPAPPSAGGCPVQIVELTDSRRGPETIGAMMTFRAMQAPADRQAWLRSVFEVGLTARGFKPSFTTGGDAAATDSVTARIRVRAIWISLLQMNKTGSVAFKASTASAGASPGPEKVYRGDRTSLNMWGSQSEFNELTNQVFAEALDALAADLRPLCSPAAAPAPAVTAGQS